jgi:hypothetical protein
MPWMATAVDAAAVGLRTTQKACRNAAAGVVVLVLHHQLLPRLFSCKFGRMHGG